jgi:hypothetical protein
MAMKRDRGLLVSILARVKNITINTNYLRGLFLPKAKKASLEFTQIQLNLLIRATDHLMDAYSSSITRGDKATVTNLKKIRDRLSKAASELHV